MPGTIKNKPEQYKLFYPRNPAAWRRWLEKNHLSAKAVWVVFHTRGSKKKSITWSEAVDIALCYGWIDSKKIKIDETSSHQYFSRRKPKSTWSKINKQKVERLMTQGKMRQAGIDAIELAKKNGSWELLDKVEELVIPMDLAEAFEQNPAAEVYFSTLSRSARKAILLGLTLAKKAETRNQRIAEVVERARQKKGFHK